MLKVSLPGNPKQAIHRRRPFVLSCPKHIFETLSDSGIDCLAGVPSTVQASAGAGSLSEHQSAALGSDWHTDPISPAGLISHVISRWVDAAGCGLLLFVHNVRYRIKLDLQWCKVSRDERQTHEMRKPLSPSM